MSIERCVMAACGPSKGNTIRWYSDRYGYAEFDVKKAERYLGAGWKAYVAGVIAGIRDQGIQLPPLNIAITSDIPPGKGLSSSAALEVAVALSILEYVDVPLEPVVIANLCREAENHYVGVPCGIMDQYAVLFGMCGHAVFIDCRSGDFQHIPVDDSFVFVLYDSEEERDLISSGYSDRNRECREALSWFADRETGVSSYRDMEISRLFEHRGEIPEVLFRRSLHVLTENRRVLKTVSALKMKDDRAVGRLLFQSHRSLTHDFGVSTQSLDNLVKKARESRYICGARLHGGGFGGYTINLIPEKNVSRAHEIMGQNGIEVRSGKGAESWRI
jgi:galactokinase